MKIPYKNDHLRQNLPEQRRKLALMKTSVDNLEKEYKVCLEKASSQTNTNKMKELVDRGAAMLKSANEKRAGIDLIQKEINISDKLKNKWFDIFTPELSADFRDMFHGGWVKGHPFFHILTQSNLKISSWICVKYLMTTEMVFLKS